jgi:outer membrane protein assembly factor BamB
MVRIEDTIYLGGDFTSFSSDTAQTVTRNHLAAVDAATGEPTTWNPNADGVVRTLVKSAEGILYAGGDFVTVHGEAHERLVAIDPAGEGTPVPTFLGSANATVRDLQIVDTSLYLGGSFTRVNDNTFRQHLAKVDLATGTVTDPSFKPRANKPVHTLRARGDQLFVGGAFTTLGGAGRVLLGSVSTSTGEVTDWTPEVVCTGYNGSPAPATDCAVLDVVVTRSRVFAGMAGPGGHLFAYSRDTAERLWGRRANGDVQVLARRGKTVYAGGHFTGWAKTADRIELVAVTQKDGKFIESIGRFRARYAPGAWAILPSSEALYLGGGFHHADRVHDNYLAFPAR